MPDSHQKFSIVTVLLHWTVALMMIGLLVVGIYMHENKAYDLYGLHKSVGVVVFFIAVARILWRVKNGWPTHLSENPAWQQFMAKAAHWLLIISTVLFPISGVLMSAFGGFGVPFFGLFDIVPSNFVDGKAVPLNAGLAQVGHIIHGLLGKLIPVVLLLHVAGALKHAVIDKDGTLRRMLGMRLN